MRRFTNVSIRAALLFGLVADGVNGFAPLVSTRLQLQPNYHAVSRQQRQSTVSFATKMTTSSQVQDSITSKIPETPPDMKAYASGYSTVFEELPCAEKTPTVGELPKDLVGTYFRCGPAMFSAGSIVPPKTSIVQPKNPPVPDGKDPSRMVKHPFEGDGAVLAVTFSGNGTATARFRFVRTIAFTNERKKGGRLYDAMDSTRDMGPTAGAGLGNDLLTPLFRHHLQPGLNKKRKNSSNTRAIYWGKRLLTLWEGGLPYKIDALALSTEGRSQLGGVLKEQSPLGAKATYDSKKNRMLLYSNVQDARSSELTLMEFNTKFRLVSEQGGKVTVKLPGFAILSDFTITENYAVFVQPPVTVSGMQFLMSKEPGKTLTVEKGPSLLHLVPRVGSNKGAVKTISIPFDGVLDADLQFCNAFEDGDTVVFDAIRSNGEESSGEAQSWPWASSLQEYSQSTSKKTLWRYTVDVRTGSVSKMPLSDMQAYFGIVNPAVSGQKHRYKYAAVGSMGSDVAPPQGIAKFDCDTKTSQVWMPKEYEFCGEPMYAPRKGSDSSEEDDGYILSVLYNGKTRESEMVVLCANDISAGPMSRVPLGMGVPHGLFGCFSNSEETSWSTEEIERRAKLADKLESKGNLFNEVKSDFSGLGLRLDDLEEYFGDIL